MGCELFNFLVWRKRMMKLLKYGRLWWIRVGWKWFVKLFWKVFEVLQNFDIVLKIFKHFKNLAWLFHLKPPTYPTTIRQIFHPIISSFCLCFIFLYHLNLLFFLSFFNKQKISDLINFHGTSSRHLYINPFNNHYYYFF